MRQLATPNTSRNPAASAGYLPVVLAATFAVVVLPLLFVVWLRSSGVLMSAWAGVVVGVAGSLAASWIGAALWKRTPHSGDVLFSDLMIWGWLHRRRSARRVEAAAELLAARGGRSPAISGRWLSNEQKTSLLAGLIADLESRDPYTNGHSRRVARYAADIASEMNLDGSSVAKIRAAGAVHDVGKIYTPTEILHKQGKLSKEEFAVIARHALDGTEMVSVLGDQELTAMVRHHHERLDGSGYPDGVAGEEIPLGARILAVADTFDAITSTRSYRRAHSHEEALRILASGTGAQHDPAVVRAFQRCYSGRRSLAIWASALNTLARATPAFGASTGGGVGAGVAVGTTGLGAAGAWVAAATVAVGGAGVAAAVEPPSNASRSEDGVAATATAASVAPTKKRKPSSAKVATAPTPTLTVSGMREARVVKMRKQLRALSAPASPSRPAPRKAASATAPFPAVTVATPSAAGGGPAAAPTPSPIKRKAQDPAASASSPGVQPPAPPATPLPAPPATTEKPKHGQRGKHEKQTKRAKKAKHEKKARHEKQPKPAGKAKHEKQPKPAGKAEHEKQPKPAGKAKHEEQAEHTPAQPREKAEHTEAQPEKKEKRGKAPKAEKP